MLIVDRIEGDYAVCERLDGRMTDIPLCAICPPVFEGDVLCFAENGLFRCDEAQTENKHEEAAALLDGLFS
ncbi:MAG: DUF3006 domain-containing protein [Eubacteriales bacterium]|nr:DUF3006 domain-containing protein [Eubacteriales bacterium]